MYRYSPKFASNWRAVAAFFIGCIPPLPGFVDNIVQAGGDVTSVSGSILRADKLPKSMSKALESWAEAAICHPAPRTCLP